MLEIYCPKCNRLLYRWMPNGKVINNECEEVGKEKIDTCEFCDYPLKLNLRIIWPRPATGLGCAYDLDQEI